MPIDHAADIADHVERTTKNPGIAARLETGPVRGGRNPIAVRRRTADVAGAARRA